MAKVPYQTKKPLPVVTPTETPVLEASAHTVSFRLSEKLSASARACSANYGISLNALASVALADYLAGRGYPVHHPKQSK